MIKDFKCFKKRILWASARAVRHVSEDSALPSQLAKWTNEGLGTKNEGLYSEKKQTKIVSFSSAFACGAAYDSLLRGYKSRQNLCRQRVVKLHSFDTFLISLVQAIMQVTKKTSKASKAAKTCVGQELSNYTDIFQYYLYRLSCRWKYDWINYFTLHYITSHLEQWQNVHCLLIVTWSFHCREKPLKC